MLDAERLRVASRQQNQLISALARTDAVLAREAGQPVSDTVLHEIEQALHGVLADPDVAERWSKGRLVKVPEAAVDFAVVAPETDSARPARPNSPRRRRSPVVRRRRSPVVRRSGSASSGALVRRHRKPVARLPGASRSSARRGTFRGPWRRRARRLPSGSAAWSTS